MYLHPPPSGHIITSPSPSTSTQAQHQHMMRQRAEINYFTTHSPPTAYPLPNNASRTNLRECPHGRACQLTRTTLLPRTQERSVACLGVCTSGDEMKCTNEGDDFEEKPRQVVDEMQDTTRQADTGTEGGWLVGGALASSLPSSMIPSMMIPYFPLRFTSGHRKPQASISH